MKKEIKPEDMIIEFNLSRIKSKLKNVQLEFPFVLDLPGEKYKQKVRDRIFKEFEEFISKKNLS